jgi:hypothetical protein
MSAVWEFSGEVSVSIDVLGSNSNSSDRPQRPQLFLDWTAMNSPLAKACPRHRSR